MENKTQTKLEVGKEPRFQKTGTSASQARTKFFFSHIGFDFRDDQPPI